MLLTNRHAIIYGAGGSLGGAVAARLAKEGATVVVTGHRLDPVQKLAAAIVAAGGKAEGSRARRARPARRQRLRRRPRPRIGTLDISFNAIGIRDRQNVPLIDMALADFVRPVTTAMETQFITSTAAGTDHDRRSAPA